LRFLAYASLLLLAAGCSGIHARQTISPATFLLPGLLQADPPAPPADPVLPETTPVNQVAFAR
jgi:hypothetical protein